MALGYEDYPGPRPGRNDFGVSSPSYSGEPGIGNQDRSSMTRHGYRAYQDYGLSDPLPGRENHSGKGPKGYRRTDEKICDEVCERLTSHYDVDASEIEVEVKEGIVTLGGTVESRRTKRMAEDVVSDIAGVMDVRNNLHIHSHDSTQLRPGDSGTGYRKPAESTDSALSKRN